jgi:hypothetical protein
MFVMYPDPRIVDIAPVDHYTTVTNGETQSLTLHLRDGTVITDVDEVWLGTGYGWAVPYVRVLEGGGDSDRRGLVHLTPTSLRLSRIPSLHRLIIYAANPTLGFVGHVMAFTPFILADVSSTWLALVWRGEIPIPTSVEGLLVSEKERLARKEAARKDVDEPSSFVHYHVLADDELEYSRALRKDIIEARRDLDDVLPVWSDEMWAKRGMMHELKLESLRCSFFEDSDAR